MNIKLPLKYKKYIIAAILVAVASLFGVDLSDLKNIQKQIVPSPTPNPAINNEVYEAKVISVVDGDTIVIEGNKKVRYIGVNTPEIFKDTTGKKTGEQCFANESLEENRRLVEGKTIKMVRDISNTDKYGRLLRYVYVDGLFVNDYLVTKGFAKTMTVKPDIRYSKTFKDSQEKAKEEKIGMWGTCPTSTPSKPPQ